jgi:hypothetical protein
VSPLTVPFGKSGIKKEDVMERCRARLVAALKTGGTFALYLGNVRLEHADFKAKLCKKVASTGCASACACLAVALRSAAVAEDAD